MSALDSFPSQSMAVVYVRLIYTSAFKWLQVEFSQQTTTTMKKREEKCPKIYDRNVPSFRREWWAENVISRLQRQRRTTKRLYPVEYGIILLDFIPSQFNTENLLYINCALLRWFFFRLWIFFSDVAVVCWSLAWLGHSGACSTCYFLSDLYTHTHKWRTENYFGL